MSNYHDVYDFIEIKDKNKDNIVTAINGVHVRDDLKFKSSSTPELNNITTAIITKNHQHEGSDVNKKHFVKNLFKIFKSQNNVNDDSTNEKRNFNATECMRNINSICKSTWRHFGVKNNNTNKMSKTTNTTVTATATTVGKSRRKILYPNKPTFYFLNIDREQAEVLLNGQDDGVFLIRNSKHFPEKLTLSLMHNTKCEHYLIAKDNINGKYSIDDNNWFDTIDDLVIYHQLLTGGLVTLLTVGLSNQDLALKYTMNINQKLIIPFDEIKFKEFIGSGEFGIVRKGEWAKKEIAIKQIKDDDLMQSFLQEANLMAKLNHKNLVQLYGISIQCMILLVTEYMPRGSLLHYLQTRGRNVIKYNELCKYSYDVCCGMSYLEKHKILHCDLCASNVLLNDNNDAKISDFGLSKNLNDVKKDLITNKVRIRWSAPEVLENKNYTTKSDIWSYGILLWEIYSFGRIPFPHVKLENLKEYLKQGNKMSSPEGCPYEIYEIMCTCWNLNWKLRPRFEVLEKHVFKIWEKSNQNQIKPVNVSN